MVGMAAGAAIAPAVAPGMSAGTKAIIGVAAAGTGVQAYGQYQAGKQAQVQAKAQAAWNRYNANVTKRREEAEARAAKFDVAQAKKRRDEYMGKLRVKHGASGVYGVSPLLAEEDAAAEWAKEIMNTRLRGQTRVQKLQSQSILDISKASAAESRAKGFGSAAVTGAGASVLGGVADTYFRDSYIRTKAIS